MVPAVIKNNNKKARFYCESCGAEVPLEAKRCPKCGAGFESVRCPACGFTGEEKAFKSGCPSCGHRVQSPSEPVNGTKAAGSVSPWIFLLAAAVFTAALAALFLRFFR